MMVNEVGKRIREERERQKLSIVALDELSGVHKNSISRIELGGSLPRVDSLAMIADALNVPIGHLLEDGHSARLDLLKSIKRLLLIERGTIDLKWVEQEIEKELMK